MAVRYKVFSFNAGSPRLAGFAESGHEAAAMLGCDRAYLAPIKGNGMCYTRSEDDEVRAAWNRPIVTPQITRA